MVLGPSVPTALDRGFVRAPHSSQQSRSNAARRRAQQRGGTVHAQAVAVEPMTERLTKSDLVQYLASGCKPRSQWRCAARAALLAVSLRRCYRVCVKAGLKSSCYVEACMHIKDLRPCPCHRCPEGGISHK